ncbi:DUF2083 domain-containing protein [Rhizobium leguminosarum]|nr:DUF2083 domain-containing protein [Rhizobium leguminosarum]
MSFGYPLWTVHQCFTSSHNTFTQWPELTYGKSYFSVPKAAHVGRHGHGRVFEGACHGICVRSAMCGSPSILKSNTSKLGAGSSRRSSVRKRSGESTPIECGASLLVLCARTL